MSGINYRGRDEAARNMVSDLKCPQGQKRVKGVGRRAVEQISTRTATGQKIPATPSHHIFVALADHSCDATGFGWQSASRPPNWSTLGLVMQPGGVTSWGESHRMTTERCAVVRPRLRGFGDGRLASGSPTRRMAERAV